MMRNKIVVLGDLLILVVLCYLVATWFAGFELLLRLGLAWLCKQFYILNLSSMISIIDLDYRIDVIVYGSVFFLVWDGFLMMKVSDYFEDF